MAYDRKDYYYKKAKQEGKASRAVYKLDELQLRFKLIRKGDTVMDLGAAPGGWMQEVSPIVGDNGLVIGIDLLPLKIQLSKNCRFILGNLEDDSTRSKIKEITTKFADVILSDMAPNLSGVAFADAYRSYELAMLSLEIARWMLKKGGHLVIKVFPGDEINDLLKALRECFEKVNMVVPKATRKTSSERYIVAQTKK